MKVKGLIISATAGAVAILAAVLFLVSAATADPDPAADNAVTTRMPMAAVQAEMPANCPMWTDAESAPAAGMYEQCQSYMAESGMGHMMGMMNMMGSGGMNAGCGMSGMMTDTAGETAACPMLGAAEPSGDHTAMDLCQQAVSES